MICILRNFNLVPAPAFGWDILPKPSENSLGANLARIKYYRNYVSHPSNSETDVKTFQDIWATLKKVSLKSWPLYHYTCRLVVIVLFYMTPFYCYGLACGGHHPSCIVHPALWSNIFFLSNFHQILYVAPPPLTIREHTCEDLLFHKSDKFVNGNDNQGKVYQNFKFRDPFGRNPLRGQSHSFYIIKLHNFFKSP